MAVFPRNGKQKVKFRKYTPTLTSEEFDVPDEEEVIFVGLDSSDVFTIITAEIVIIP
jgi:hypothetical protein